MYIPSKSWLWSVCINMGVYPQNSRCRPYSLHSIDWSYSLWVIATEHNRELLSSEWLLSSLLKSFTWFIYIVPVAFTFPVSLYDILICTLVALAISDIDHLTWDSATFFHLLKPFLWEEPMRGKLRAWALLPPSKRVADNMNRTMESSSCEGSLESILPQKEGWFGEHYI